MDVAGKWKEEETEKQSVNGNTRFEERRDIDERREEDTKLSC